MEGQCEGNPAAPDAIDILAADHQRVDGLFRQFEKLKSNGDDDSKHAIVKRICAELTLHAQIEAEIFYPVARNTLDADDLLDQAEIQHTSAAALITQLNRMHPHESLYNATVTILGKYVRHHIQEEQEHIFPRIKKTETDLQALAFELIQRKRNLMARGMVEGATVESENMAVAASSRK